MQQMTTSQARVIDPVLTEVARGYKNMDLVGDALFPAVPVQQRGGRVVQFRREDFRLYSTGRVPGTKTNRVTYGYDSTNYTLESHSLEGVVPFEIMQDANAVPGIDMGRVAIMRTQNIIALRKELQQATLATNAALYATPNKQTLSGASQWSNSASNPVADAETAKEAIRASVGRYPNTVVMGARVMAALKTNPQIIDRIKYTGRDVPTTELIASLFGVDRVLVGGAVYLDSAETIQDVWGKFCIFAYTERSGISDMGVPSYGYTYQLGGYPVVEVPYQDRNAKSWIYPVTDEVAPVLAGAEAGYLFSAAVA